jgi:hypothetical protein
MSNMTPFEIRLELLKMAQSMLTDDYMFKRTAVENQWNAQVDAAKIACQPPPELPPLPPYPTETDVIRKATELNSFVSQIPNTQEKGSKKST